MSVTVAIITAAVIVTLAERSNGACPNIISRSEWGARSANSRPLRVSPPTHVVIHHAASNSCTNKASCIKLVKSFQDLHIDNRKWGDIGYNFVVGEDGNVYEGRGWGKMGAHAPNYNSKSIGICVIGTFSSKVPNDAALQAVKDLIACGVSQGKIKEDYQLIGHRQVRDTECPGNSLYQQIKGWPNWTANP